eukprot:TRINITY_DN4862_c0_g1_i1.p1 TRINITY_DN4862_c0_g1~~TRINITY_DN4862_c0_g1_i1.p1  ORF type:complete len:2039 (+),score=385.80 TRINITY_DN4862_c0_g1_i1:454-6570(+)
MGGSSSRHEGQKQGRGQRQSRRSRQSGDAATTSTMVDAEGMAGAGEGRRSASRAETRRGGVQKENGRGVASREANLETAACAVGVAGPSEDTADAHGSRRSGHHKKSRNSRRRAEGGQDTPPDGNPGHAAPSRPLPRSLSLPARLVHLQGRRRGRAASREMASPTRSRRTSSHGHGRACPYEGEAHAHEDDDPLRRREVGQRGHNSPSGGRPHPTDSRRGMRRHHPERSHCTRDGGLHSPPKQSSGGTESERSSGRLHEDRGERGPAGSGDLMVPRRHHEARGHDLHDEHPRTQRTSEEERRKRKVRSQVRKLRQSQGGRRRAGARHAELGTLQAHRHPVRNGTQRHHRDGGRVGHRAQRGCVHRRPARAGHHRCRASDWKGPHCSGETGWTADDYKDQSGKREGESPRGGQGEGAETHRDTKSRRPTRRAAGSGEGETGETQGSADEVAHRKGQEHRGVHSGSKKEETSSPVGRRGEEAERAEQKSRGGACRRAHRKIGDGGKKRRGDGSKRSGGRSRRGGHKKGRRDDGAKTTRRGGGGEARAAGRRAAKMPDGKDGAGARGRAAGTTCKEQRAAKTKGREEKRSRRGSRTKTEKERRRASAINRAKRRTHRKAANKAARCMHENSMTAKTSVRISNISSIMGGIATAVKETEDLHLLVETRHGERGAMQTCRNVMEVHRRQGESCSITYGDAVDGAVGIAIIAKGQYADKVRLQQAKGEAKSWQKQGRLAVFEVAVKVAKRHKQDSGEGKLFAIGIYGEQSDRQRQNERLYKAAAEEAERRRDFPVIIAGDFNKTSEDSTEMTRWAIDGSAVDINVYMATLEKRKAFKFGPGSQEIDYTWCNEKALQLVAAFKRRQHVFATHHTMELEISVEAYSEQLLRRSKPLPFPKPKRELEEDELEAIRSHRREEWTWATAKWEERDEEGSWEGDDMPEDEKRRRLNRAVEVWSERAERYMAARAEEDWHPARRQRGKIQPVRKMWSVPEQRRSDMNTASAEERVVRIRQVDKAQRKLEALRKMQPGRKCFDTWNNLRRLLKAMVITRNYNIKIEESMPNEETSRQLAKDLANAKQLEMARMKQNRCRAWAEQMETNQVYKFVANKEATPLSHVNVAPKEEEPNYVTCIEDIDKHVSDWWKQIWRPPDKRFKKLEEEMLKAVPAMEAWEMEPITARKVTDALAEARGAPGPDGWATDELRRVRPLHDQLATIMNIMEAWRISPDVATCGDITLIPKANDRTHYTELRPITVLSTIHRTWGSLRLRTQLFRWQEKLLGDTPIRGCRRTSSIYDLTWPLMLDLEEAATQGRALQIVSFDLEKAFDKLPVQTGTDEGLAWKLLDKCGYPKAMLGVMKDQYEHMRRRFKIRSCLGREIEAGGILAGIQGCSLTMLIMNIVTLAWHNLQRKGIDIMADDDILKEVQEATGWSRETCKKKRWRLTTPTEEPRLGSYADDMHVATSEQSLLIRATDLTFLWSRAAGASLNAGKSMVFGDTVVKMPHGKYIPNAKDLALLGSHIEKTHARGRAARMEEKRLEELKRRLEQTKKLPLARRRKLEIIAQAVIPVLFSWEYVNLPGDEVQRLRRSIWEAARGGRQLSTLYVLEVLFTIAAPGHRLDPAQVGDYRTLSTFANLKHLDKESLATLARQWARAHEEQQTEEKPPWGPTRRLKETMESIGWQWTNPRELKTHKGTVYELPVSTEETQKFLHDARSALRRREMQDTQAAKRKTKHAKPRTDLAGVEEGVAWDKNRVALQSLGPYDAASVIQIMAGAQMTRDRAYRQKRWDITDTPLCLTCGTTETREHTLWTCRRWQHLRPAWFRRLAERRHQLQPCLVWCGIATKRYAGPEIWHIQRIFATIEKARRLYDPFPEGTRRAYQIPQPHPPKPPEDDRETEPPRDQADDEEEANYADYDSEEEKSGSARRRSNEKKREEGAGKASAFRAETKRPQRRSSEEQQREQAAREEGSRTEERSRREDFLRRRRKRKAKGWDEESSEPGVEDLTWEEENEAWQDNYDANRRPEWQRRAEEGYQPSRLRRIPKPK